MCFPLQAKPLSANYKDWGLNLLSNLHLGFVKVRQAALKDTAEPHALIAMGVHQYPCSEPLGELSSLTPPPPFCDKPLT
jgi:hypothetical protein